ncbi:MAG: signal peptidase I [Bacteroidales bacterium]|nr:signal peptidase I [Bacteroidales bacterium]
MTPKEFFRNKWVRFGFWAALYVLWVIWLGCYWWLFGLVVIFDGFITKKVKWLFWKPDRSKDKKPNVLLEWLDAIIFAVVVVTFINMFFFQAFKIPSSSMESSLYTGDHLFVSKLSYGPRIPMTPLTIPFTHNVIGSRESYSTLIQNKYRRLKGFGHLKRGDYVVFGFPNGDSVLTKAPAEDYYMAVRLYGRDYVQRTFGPVKARPMDKVDHYVKRCVAVPGDSLTIINGKVWVNGEPLPVWKGVQTTYEVATDGKRINSKTLDKLGMNSSELWFNSGLPGYPSMPMTETMLEAVCAMPNVVYVEEDIDVWPPDAPDSYLTIFPFTEDYRWTRDNFGPLWIPYAGATVELNLENLPLYERLITTYEGNELRVGTDGEIYINGEKTDTYTFAQDYYWMMGDNRHNSLDSRYWGFVPEDHIVGKPVVIWFSSDAGKPFPKNVRWRRLFKFV